MGSSSRFHGGYNGGFACGHAASCAPAELQLHREEKQQQLTSSQIQHHLNQISMDMNMDDELALYLPSGCNGAGVALDMLDNLLPSSSSSLLSASLSCSQESSVHFLPAAPPTVAGGYFRSPSSSSSMLSASLSCSPESSVHFLPAVPAAVAGGHCPEVSSHVPLAPGAPCNHQCMSFDDVAAAAPAEISTSAFKRYARHLAPRRPPKPGACGQRMFKTAMSVLAKMHLATRYSHRYYYQEAAEPPPTSGNQLQHMISERKRREKLNDSFHALKKVLPPGSKKDKTSILITARDYVNSLKSRVCELEKKNQALQSRLDRRANTGAGEDDAEASDKVEIEVTRVAAAEEDPRELCTVKVAMRSPCGNMADVAVRTLQCLKDLARDDVSLVAMSSGAGAGGASGPPRANLTLQLKSMSPGVKWDEESVKQAVAKAIADVLQPPQPVEPSAARREGDGDGDGGGLIAK